MKSLNDNYSSSRGNSHETFADLMFCALIVLVLFIMALAIEVSTRVKASSVLIPEPVAEVSKEELSSMTKEEVAELSKELNRQRDAMTALKEKLKSSEAQIEAQQSQVSNKLAAMGGEQRFTGAREPASLTMAYNYSDSTYHFLSARENSHAIEQSSGETRMEYALRKTEEFVAIALKARKQRGYTRSEATAIYQAFSTYKEVEPNFESYKIVDSVVGINYVTSLSGYIAGESEMSEVAEELVVQSLLAIYKNPGPKSDQMYPRVVLRIDVKAKKIVINGVSLSPRDTKEILLSISGRGAMIDLEGLSGKPPEWLTEDVLIPAGYISKTPKVPQN